ncbi:TlpA family protein disulfide reductase [Tenacibaculum amylolyticum]|uniref:TlpA family protein disulfide reductase n=1 Tax=Tenacibaculum amylolyticum TaxID=104269 RepID=UPI0038933BC1
MKKLVLCLFLLSTGLLFGQRLSFSIRNDSINNEFFLTKINGKIVERITIDELNFTLDTNLDDDYYILEKEDDKILLYLKRNDEFAIAFDADDINNSIAFSGKRGAGRNTYLHSKRTPLLDRTGNKKNFYKKAFYKGDENEYLARLDNFYKGFYGTLFSGGFDQGFIDEESKNLQYGYYLDMLKFDSAKKHYKFNDSIKASDTFLAPLSSLHFDNQLFSDTYDSYNDLAILKWKRDIENSNDYPVMEDIIASIRVEAIQQGVLESLYEAMSNETPDRQRTYYEFIKKYAKTNKLIAKAKEKYAEVRQVEAEKNLSKFSFLNTNQEKVKLADFKGNFIFLYIWASFCKECVEEFKNIQELRDKFADKNIVFVGVSIDKEENYDEWVQLVKENGLKASAEQLFYDGSKSRFVKAYNLSTIPKFVILSLKGEVIPTKTTKVSSKKTERLLNKLVNGE